LLTLFFLKEKKRKNGKNKAGFFPYFFLNREKKEKITNDQEKIRKNKLPWPALRKIIRLIDN